jgi:hypothetical protein
MQHLLDIKLCKKRVIGKEKERIIIKEKVWRVEGKIERYIINVEGEDNHTFGIYP